MALGNWAQHMLVVSFVLGIFVMQVSLGAQVRISTEVRILGGQNDSSTVTPSRLLFSIILSVLLLLSGTKEGIQDGRSRENDRKEGFSLILPLLSCHERVNRQTDTLT